jgi:hypothetical protein
VTEPHPEIVARHKGALGMVRPDVVGLSEGLEIVIVGQRYPLRPLGKSSFDPGNARRRS